MLQGTERQNYAVRMVSLLSPSAMAACAAAVLTADAYLQLWTRRAALLHRHLHQLAHAFLVQNGERAGRQRGARPRLGLALEDFAGGAIAFSASGFRGQ